MDTDNGSSLRFVQQGKAIMIEFYELSALQYIGYGMVVGTNLVKIILESKC